MVQDNPGKAELPRLALVSNRYRFVYVPVPKCGTTTMIQVMASLHGIEKTGRVRRMMEPTFWTSKDATQGSILEYWKVAPPNRQAFLNAYKDYRFISIVRDPVARTVSNYRNKLNRYAGKFAKPAYLAGKLAAYLFPFSMKRQLEAQNMVMRRLIPSGSFVAGLEAHGVMWDRHFWPQATVLALDRVHYDALLHLEQLEVDLVDFLKRCGVSEEDLERILPLPRHNSSLDADAQFDVQALAAIARIYERDMTELGYRQPAS